MPISLHAAIVPSMSQLLGAAHGWLGKASESGLADAEICEARLFDDMLPFAYQIKSMAVHSAGAIEGVRNGTFSPDRSDPPTSFDGLRARLAEAEAKLSAISEREMESFIGQDMLFSVPDYDIAIPFDAEQFLLSFSQPNFYFHAVTAYDILRMKGVAVGKMDYMGQMRARVV